MKGRQKQNLTPSSCDGNTGKVPGVQEGQFIYHYLLSISVEHVPKIQYPA